MRFLKEFRLGDPIPEGAKCTGVSRWGCDNPTGYGYIGHLVVYEVEVPDPAPEPSPECGDCWRSMTYGWITCAVHLPKSWKGPPPGDSL